MLARNNRKAIALIGSLLLHMLFLSTIGLSRSWVSGRLGSEVYETMDFIERLESGSAKLPKKRLLEGRLTDVGTFEIILLDKDALQKALPKIRKLHLPELEEAIKNKPRIAPIVRAPMVKPKLLAQSKVPYPVNGDGKIGTVIVCVLVGLDGRPEYVSTAGSSGSPVLDGAAIEHCIKYRFLPAQDDKGNKVRCLVYLPVEVSP